MQSPFIFILGIYQNSIVIADEKHFHVVIDYFDYGDDFCYFRGSITASLLNWKPQLPNTCFLMDLSLLFANI